MLKTKKSGCVIGYNECELENEELRPCDGC
jgi:hypothetical protein